MNTNTQTAVGYLPDERPTFIKLLLYAVQQVIVMFPATVTVALVTGFQVSTTIFIQRMRNTPRFILLTVIHAVEILFNLCLFVGCIQSWNTVKMMTFSTVPIWNYQLLYIPLILAAPVMIFYLVVQNIEFYHTMFPKKGVAG